MHKEILIDSSHGEIRVAVVENGKLAELYIEQEDTGHYAGDIYKGRVEDILPGIGSAFVDIGHDKRGFLQAADVVLTGIEDIDEFFMHQMGQGSPSHPARGAIGDTIRVGQDLLVQITKESIGDKGPKLTTAITLPGRYLVLMPYADRVNISSRIDGDDERERLRRVVEEGRPAPHGFIVRTAARGVESEYLYHDMDELVDAWNRLLALAEKKTAPSLLHKDKDLLERVLRDQFTDDVDVLIADSLPIYDRVCALAERSAPHIVPRVRLYDDEHPIFDAFGIEPEIDRMFRRKIWLRSGGYIVIDEAEALVAVDVNTGRFLGKGDQEETIVKTNIEAAAEIARQLRLRNVGGLIIIDFIDMIEEGHRREVLVAFREHMSRDRTRSKILDISDLGLVEMTRQRQRGSLVSRLSRPCPYCRGRGQIMDFEVIGVRLARELDRRFHSGHQGEVTVYVHPRVKEYLEAKFAARLTRLELDHGAHIRFLTREDGALDAVEIVGQGGDYYGGD